MSGYSMDGYVTVPERVALFYKRYPEGSLQMDPVEFLEIEGKRWAMGRAYAYRTPDDPRPGIGTAWEIVPGTTPFTRGSEIQNLETSAWGRAIGALGIGIEKSLATIDEIQQAKERQKVIKTSEPTPDDDEFYTPKDPHANSYSLGTTSKASDALPATAPQIKAIHAILSKRGLKDELDRLASVNYYLTKDLCKQVASLCELGKHTASQIIDHYQTLTDP
jgi:hypothetical protein